MQSSEKRTGYADDAFFFARVEDLFEQEAETQTERSQAFEQATTVDGSLRGNPFAERRQRVVMLEHAVRGRDSLIGIAAENGRPCLTEVGDAHNIRQCVQPGDRQDGRVCDGHHMDVELGPAGIDPVIEPSGTTFVAREAIQVFGRTEDKRLAIRSPRWAP